ncbi:hypothetical protein TraAM80_02042 [Trypanosoma rangeli]|uniref:Uncharacterized protein n=1 Tax=Trypanosoma rangeli TaxID=5698 RepID=A0A422NW27_TRYRA|nr:uncharacterized protein TraAM80_02042 [Trypanosoma rangeli]RNF09687.1 hypothetical protein TraAM80_02042 [Trypanosoma rangeli]|eukprot:RNF09687.1 hypothetical protein TraAM80_02042 [Trypanosoma rangeli]
MFPHGGGCGPLPHPPTQRRRGEVGGNVQRSRVCPSAARVYRFLTDDVATQNKACSKVLQAPSAAVFNSTTLLNDVSYDVTVPTVVLTVWQDTTLADIAMLVLEGVREDIDRVFLATQGGTKGGVESDVCSLTSRCAAYVVKLYSGSVDANGTATLCALATIELRQVVSQTPFVFPVRCFSSFEVDTTVSRLPYRLGDPFFLRVCGCSNA